MAAGSPPSPAGRCRRPLALLLGLGLPALLGGCGLAGLGVSEAGRQRCRSQAAAAPLLLRPWRELRCLPGIDRQLAAEASRRREQQEQAERERKAQLARCREQGPALAALVEAWRRTEQELADLRLERYRPLPPPPPIDEERESRYRPEDQELDRERYESDLAAWRQQEGERRARWQARQRAQEATLRERQRQDLAALRKLQPAVLRGDRLDEAAVLRHTRCADQNPRAAAPA
ncbi:MAG: hypothetical protein VKJ66_03465 [Synechococcus sp.]|nr:hypothetical protein [Synechococcus sp.]